MSVRTSRATVTFAHPFTIANLDEVQPAGDYLVETDEERMEAVSFLAYRRIRTIFHLHAKSGDPSMTRQMAVEPDDLDAALRRDREAPPSPVAT